MAKLFKLRFLDTTNKEKPTFITLFADGKRKGFFKQNTKEQIDKSADRTSCRVQKKLLTEVRTFGNPWKQVDRDTFKSFLRDINVIRIKAGWETVELPELEVKDGDS